MKLLASTIIAFFKKIFSKYFIIIDVFFILLVLYVGYYLLLSPNIKRLQAGKSLGYEARKEEEARLVSHLEGLESMRLDFKGITEDKLNELALILPREEDFAGIFVQMQDIALKNNFILNSIDISHIDSSGSQEGNSAEESNNSPQDNETKDAVADASGGRIKQLNISFSIGGGNYEDLKNFLRSIEKNIRIFDIYDIRFGSVDGGPFNIDLRTYYLVF